ncbi:MULTISPECIES: PAS domain S-box protein [unclassified Streptomyces]|uniref:PAS domain S-box protein n=1 Tax=unclassified Streptomyces TaxID=2593676 RepID=UPI0035D9A4F6
MSEHEQREGAGSSHRGGSTRPRGVLDQIRIATWLIGSDGRTIVAWGAQASELLGYRPEEVLGRDATRVLSFEPDQARAAASLDRVLAGERFAGVDLILRRDGQRVPVEFRSGGPPRRRTARAGNGTWAAS